MLKLAATLAALLVFCMGGFAPAQAEKRVALVIGNSAYEQVARLPNPASDARAVAAALKRLGFAVTLKLDQDYSGLRRTLGAFSRTAAGADIAAIFYAGHGIEVGGQNYLIPTDARLSNASDVDFEAIPFSTAMGALEGAKGLKLAILDACRNNPFTAKMTRIGATRAVGRGLARVSPRGSDTLVAYAAKEGTTADDGDGKHSPYTTALLKHLETPGLEIRLLFGRVRDSVLAGTGRRQEPFTYGSLGGEAIYLKSGSRPAAPPQRSDELAALRKELEALKGRLDTGQTRSKEPKVAIGVFPPKTAPGRQYKPGDEFQDCGACPKMVVVPAGSFMMGSPESEKRRQEDEGPRRKVRIPRAFAVGKFEVTKAQFEAFVNDTGHDGGKNCKATHEGGAGKTPSGFSWRDPGFSQGSDHPVACVNWSDASAYLIWLSRKTGKSYRLLSEAEWEYAARAGTTGNFSTGRRITSDQANFNGNQTYNGSSKGRDLKKTISVGSLVDNTFWLFDMHGNVWEWVEDCYKDSYANAPADGSARTSGSCSRRVLRGGAWGFGPWDLRSANRYWSAAGSRFSYLGFRVARTLTP